MTIFSSLYMCIDVPQIDPSGVFDI